MFVSHATNPAMLGATVLATWAPATLRPPSYAYAITMWLATLVAPCMGSGCRGMFGG